MSDVNLLHADLVTACQLGMISECTQLLQAGIPPNACNTDGQLPLHAAAEAGNRAIVELLLQHKANVNKRAHHRNSILHAAALQQDPSIIGLLAAAGAKAHVRNDRGYTAAHVAALQGNAEVLAALLSLWPHAAAVRDKVGCSCQPVMISMATPICLLSAYTHYLAAQCTAHNSTLSS